jgi:hypothetical protein
MWFFRKIPQVYEGGFRCRRRCLPTVDGATSIPSLSISRECGVLPTRSWLGTFVESSRQSLRPHAVFPDDGGTSKSSSGRTRSDASGPPCPAARCASNAASPARATTTVSTAFDLTASGADSAVRCVGEQQSGDAKPQSRPVWQRWSETSSRPAQQVR